MSANNTPTCPTDCTSLLPVNTYDVCKQDIYTGEIERIFLATVDAECFTDWTLPTEWTARISETSLDPDAIRMFRGIGDFPVATNDETEISLGQKYFTEKTFVVNFDVEDCSSDNYNFMRQTECQFTMRLWWEAAGLLFGGNCGVLVNVNANYNVERGQKTLHHIMFTFTWDDNYHPERCASPVA